MASDEIFVGSLADVLGELRRELDSARARLAESGEEALLELQQAAVEMEFVVERSREKDGRFDFKVLSFGAKGGKRQAATHRLSLTLTPIGRVVVAEPQSTDGAASDGRPPGGGRR